MWKEESSVAKYKCRVRASEGREEKGKGVLPRSEAVKQMRSEGRKLAACCRGEVRKEVENVSKELPR